jgi:hypothetical protein
MFSDVHVVVGTNWLLFDRLHPPTANPLLIPVRQETCQCFLLFTNEQGQLVEKFKQLEAARIYDCYFSLKFKRETLAF